MELLALAVTFVGLVISLVGGIWLIVVAFQQHWGWGLACLLIPCAALVFVIQFWDDAKKPFLIGLAGNILLAIGSMMMPAGKAGVIN